MYEWKNDNFRVPRSGHFVIELDMGSTGLFEFAEGGTSSGIDRLEMSHAGGLVAHRNGVGLHQTVVCKYVNRANLGWKLYEIYCLRKSGSGEHSFVTQH
jgi:hypothetical protein